MHDFFKSKGILHQRSCVENPQQNGIVERKHQHILNVARALSFQAHLPHKFWNFAIQHAVHLINRIVSPLLQDRCPLEILHNTPPTLLHLKSFGCLSYASTLQAHRTKFQPRAMKRVFLGYKEGTKGYILYDLKSLINSSYPEMYSFMKLTFPIPAPHPRLLPMKLLPYLL